MALTGMPALPGGMDQLRAIKVGEVNNHTQRRQRCHRQRLIVPNRIHRRRCPICRIWPTIEQLLNWRHPTLPQRLIAEGGDMQFAPLPLFKISAEAGFELVNRLVKRL